MESKLKWVKEYEESLIMWQETISITRNVEAQIKKEGLSEKFYQEFEQNCQTRLKTEKINKFRDKIQQALIEELSMSPEV